MAAGRPRNERDKTGPKPPTPAELQAQAQEASRTQQYEDALAAGEVDMVRRGRSNAGQPQRISQEQFTAQRVADMQGAAMTRNPSNEFGYIPRDAEGNLKYDPRFDAGLQARQRPIRDDYGVQQGEFSDARISNIIDPEQNYILTQEERAALEGTDGIPTDPFAPPGGGGGGGGIGAAYENYFANQEKYAQEKFDSITDYLDELQISSDEGFAADMDNKKLYIHKGGTYLTVGGAVGDPTSGSTGTGAITIPAGFITCTPAVGIYGANAIFHFNFGSANYTISSGNSDANSQGNFEHSVPSGYFSLNSSNLAEYG